MLCGAIGDTKPHNVIASAGTEGMISVCATCHDRISGADIRTVTNNLMVTEIDKIRSAGRELTCTETLTIHMLWAVAIFIRDSHNPEQRNSWRQSDLDLLRILETPKHRVVNGQIVPLLEDKPHRQARITRTPRRKNSTPGVSFVVTPELKKRVADMRAAGFPPTAIAKACGITLRPITP